MVLVEAVVCSVWDAVEAEKAGADRVEICVDIETAGLTPPYKLVQEIRQSIQLPIVVMIRTRPGNYVFSGEEKDVMVADAARFAPIADGLIFGAMTSDNSLDSAFLSQMIVAAAGTPCVIHRSIDTAIDYAQALDEAVRLGFRRILTSGDAANAFEGRQKLAEVHERYGSQVEILAAGGIRADNVKSIVEDSGVSQVHLGPRRFNPDSLDPDALAAVIAKLR